jgi:plasmid stabilization system protein ParE
MTKRLLRIHSQAQRDIREAFDWYNRRSQDAAEGFLGEIGGCLSRIITGPRTFPLFTKNTRKLVMGKFPYSIIFREKDGAILIVAVAHAKRRPGYWQKRI